MQIGTGHGKPCQCHEKDVTRRGDRKGRPYAVCPLLIAAGLPMSLRGPKARGNPFSFRSLRERAMLCIAGDADCHAALRLAMTWFSADGPIR